MTTRTTRLVRAAVTAALTGTLALGVTAGTSGSAAAVPLGRSGNPTGTDAGSLPNGKGNLGVSLATAGAEVKVSWERPAPPSKLRNFVVKVGINRKLDSKVRSFRAGPGRQSLVVPHAFGATPASGNYSFVKVVVVRKSGQRGSSPTKWIQAPIQTACPADAPQARIGTFNVRTWKAEKPGDRFSWDNRGENVVAEILDSGARALAIQEASGAPNLGYGGKRQAEWILDRLNETDPTPGHHWVDGLGVDAYKRTPGSPGTRIFYDRLAYTELDSGLRQIIDPQGAPTLVPWVRLQATAGGQAPFVLASIHLQVGNQRRDFTIRGRQSDEVATIARDLRDAFGNQVVVAGDFNSTVNTKPYNNVHVKLLAAGLYDMFAAQTIQNARFGTTNEYHFPLRQTPYRRDYIMTLGALPGSCGYANRIYRSPGDVASDHFLQVAQVPVPVG